MHTRELEQQFERRIEEHRKILYKVCNAYCSRQEDREDLAQEVLIQLWRSFPNFDGRCLFSTWMYRVALNTAISFSRRELRRTRMTVSVEENVLPFIPAQEGEGDKLRLLHQLIASLDPLNKALLLLYLDGNSYQEISQVLGISATNAATKINRLKESLKEQVTADERQGRKAQHDHSR